MPSLIRIVAEEYKAAGALQADAKKKLASNDEARPVFESEEDERWARIRGLPLSPLVATLAVGVPKKVFGVFRRRYQAERSAIEKIIDEKNTGPLDEIALRSKLEITTPYRTRSLRDALVELAGAKVHNNQATENS